jgi:murein DD-endopeptidase MepM/ murein hydrolase activator NlpD
MGLRILLFSCLALLLSGPAAAAASLRSPVLGNKGADDTSCTVQGQTSTFTNTDSEVFIAFFADRVLRGESLRIDWTSPSGDAVSSVPYEGLPAAPALCFVSHLPIAGFAPGAQPGQWSVRIFVNNQLVATKLFVIKADPNAGAARIDAVMRTASSAAESEFVLDGHGFTPGSVVHIGQLSGGAWRYIHAAMPVEASATRLKVTVPLLTVGEYLAVIRDEQDRVSNSLRFVIATRESYKLPLPAGEPWRLTQGPYGGFSHYGQARHAYDIAPTRGRCLVAMRGGTVHTFDRGLSQSHASRTFGNYITIDHGDGEYSHYAHLQSGKFIVRTGQRVEQGQALAIAGNSGYTFPYGAGHHVHVHVTRFFSISSQSIPFEFEDLKGSARFRGVVTSANRSPYCDCAKPGPNFPQPIQIAGLQQRQQQQQPRPGAKQQSGAVAVADWWSNFLTVSPASKSVEVSLVWDGEQADLDLHLVSPSGRHYGWYGNVSGYSGQDGKPERFEIPNPEPGQWRISVQGMKGSGISLIPFRVETYVAGVRASR